MVRFICALMLCGASITLTMCADKDKEMSGKAVPRVRQYYIDKLNKAMGDGDKKIQQLLHDQQSFNQFCETYSHMLPSFLMIAKMRLTNSSDFDIANLSNKLFNEENFFRALIDADRSIWLDGRKKPDISLDEQLTINAWYLAKQQIDQISDTNGVNGNGFVVKILNEDNYLAKVFASQINGGALSLVSTILNSRWAFAKLLKDEITKNHKSFNEHFGNIRKKGIDFMSVIFQYKNQYPLYYNVLYSLYVDDEDETARLMLAAPSADNKMAEEIERLKKMLADRDRELADNKRELAERDLDLSESKEKFAKKEKGYNDAIQKLESRLEKTNEKVNNQKIAIAQSENQFKQRKDDLDKKSKELKEIKNSKDQVEKDNISLKEKLQETDDDRANLRQEQEKSQKESTKLKKELEEKSLRVDQLEEDLKKTRDDFEQSKVQIVSLEVDNKKIPFLQKENQKLREELFGLNDQLKESQNTFTLYKDKAKKKEQEQADKNGALLKQVEELTQKTEEFEQTKKDLEEKRDDVYLKFLEKQQSFKELEKESQVKTDHITKLESDKSKILEKNYGLATQHAALKTKVRELDDKNTKLEGSLKKHTKTVKQKETALRHQIHNNNELTDYLKNSNNKNQLLNEENKKLQAELEKIKSQPQVKDLTLQLALLRGENEKLRTENNGWEKNLQEQLQKAGAGYRNSIEKLESKQENQLAQMNNELRGLLCVLEQSQQDLNQKDQSLLAQVQKNIKLRSHLNIVQEKNQWLILERSDLEKLLVQKKDQTTLLLSQLAMKEKKIAAQKKNFLMIAYSNPNTRILDQLSINSISQKVDQNYKALTDQHTRLLDKNRQQKSQIQEMSKHNQMLNAELEKADNDYKMLHDLFQKQRNGLFLLQKFEPILKSIQAFKKKGDTYELYVLPEDAEKLFKVILESQSISWDGFNMFEKTDMNVGADSGNSKN